jgi:hypothetical protein
MNIKRSHAQLERHRLHPRGHSAEEETIRDGAQQKGERYYFFPRPCKLGHISKRLVRRAYCHECKKLSNHARKAQRSKTEPWFDLYNHARQRARETGAQFALTLAGVKNMYPVDGRCPVLGIELQRGSVTQDQSPSLDRLDPTKGYVPSNVTIISYLANRIKQQETDPNVFERIAVWMIRPQTSEEPNPSYRAFIRQTRMLANAKTRARVEGFGIDITWNDLDKIWPDDNRCPIFGTVFERGKTSHIPTSPTLDRIKPTLGYVSGNIAVISHRANAIKNNVNDPAVFLKIAKWLRERK